MPQIAQIAETYASQAFWMLVVFGLIYFGIGRSMLPRIEATVDARNSRVADDLAAASRARESADATEEAWRTRMAAARNDAQAVTAAAKDTAAKAGVARVKQADMAANDRVADAETSIRASTATALASIEGAAVEAARDMVAKLSGAQVPPDAAAAAVREAMARG